jgi:hypothetical protein
MRDTMTRYLAGVTIGPWQTALRYCIRPLIDRLSTHPLSSAGLAINGAGATFAKIGAAPFYVCVKGKLLVIPAGTAMPALTGVAIPAGQYNVACYFVDSGGLLTMAAGTPASTLASVKFPEFPVGKALIGVLVITNAGAFVGGTTPLDTATTVYLSPMGGFDPTALV